MAKFKKTVVFEPGYNYLHETGPRRRGQHGMTIRFSLIGPNGAAQFSFGTRWTPLGEVDKEVSRDKYAREPCHIDTWSEPGTFGMRFGLIPAPSGICIGLHSPKPFKHDPNAEMCTASVCDILPGKVCYFDASYTASDEVLRKFISDGEPAVWNELKGWYKNYFEKEE